MAYRYTVKDVRSALVSYRQLLDSVGIDAGELELQEGSGSSAYRLLLDGVAAPGTDWNGYLGRTAREATLTLHTIIRTLAAIDVALTKEQY